MTSKTPIEFRNTTNYFSPAHSADTIRVASPALYRNKVQKQEGYQMRLYYEYKYCLSLGGQTLYYTFTYNEKHIPKYRGRNVFDYADLQYLLNGGLKQYLKRNYGTKFKYFVGAELGEGAGQRGYANNPHYHVLFFLRPDDSEDAVPFSAIAPAEFRHLCRYYWQGFDEDEDRELGVYHRYENAKYGIVKEGNHCGVVNGYQAIQYVSKYVTKDAAIRSMEREIIQTAPFFNPRYIVGLSPSAFLSAPFYYNRCVFVGWRSYSDMLARDELRVFRNRYSNKCRISNGVGEYALEFIEDKLNPFVPIPTKHGSKNRSINLYYYRKLYTDVVKDDFGNPIYKLNELGLQYRINHLFPSIKTLKERLSQRLGFLDSDLYYKVVRVFPCLFGGLSFYEFKAFLEKHRVSDVLHRYALYKKIYEFHYYEENQNLEGRYDFERPNSHPRITPLADYIRFQTPTIGMVDYHPNGAADFFARPSKGWYLYQEHPFFVRYLGVFRVLDCFTYYLDTQMDNKVEAEAEADRLVYNFHKHKQLNSYFNACIQTVQAS